jgi:hypothetical protein
MKYFTLDWWQNCCEQRDAAEPYFAYLDGIRSQLPPDLIRLLDEVNLHDARLRLLALDVKAGSLELRLDGYKYTPQWNEECRRSILLSYLGVQGMQSTADPEAGFGGPYGYGDLGYDEIELLPDGSIGHRLLFSSGIEMAIQFRSFRVAFEDVRGAEGSPGS